MIFDFSKTFGKCSKTCCTISGTKVCYRSLAKPDFKNKKFSDWELGIRIIAQFPNAMCKVSGLVTEADWNNGQLQTLPIV